MSKIALTPSASGTGVFTISSPATNTDRTLTLPDEAGVVLTTATAGVPIGGPAFSAYASTSQAVSSSTDTKVVFDTETFDTNSNFANSRFTPTVAGYYQLNTTIRFNGTSQSQYTIYFYKNGVKLAVVFQLNVSASTLLQPISTFLYLNGSTDYIEVYASTVATSPTLGATNVNTNYFSGFLARSAT